jgi:hypothetical protein
MAHVGFTGFRGVMIGLMAVSGGEERVLGGGDGVLCLEMSFRFPVMLRGFLLMVRGIVMMERRRMFAGHA